MCLEKFTLEMLTDKIGLTEYPGPSYVADIVGYLNANEVAIVIDLDEVSSISHQDEKEVYVRLLSPAAVGWIHIDYIEKAE